MKEIKLKCIKSLTVEYSNNTGVCGDFCCGGLYIGEADHTFEVGEEYEFEMKEHPAYYDLVHMRDDYQNVYIFFENKIHLNDYFIEIPQDS